MFARAMTLSAAVGLLALSGCGPGKLDETKNWTLDPNDSPAHALILSAQPKPQTVTVEYDSTAGEISVGVFKDADAKSLDTIQWSKAIKTETGKKSGTLVVDIPENTATQVVIGDSAKKTDVKVHVTNMKK
ncbi:MAG: hypothetical protein JWO38_4121 [Gemmataceae bacterium]|nr:hypothetical protein [Gemmataceae bacterium]